MGQHRLAGYVAYRVDVRVVGPAAIVDLDEGAAVGEPNAGRLEPEAAAPGPAAHRDEHSIKRLGVLTLQRRLDAVTGLAQPGHLRAQVNGREQLLDPAL